ncbi:MAG: tRNA (guanosine(46)-N7)-methyltransferase TrmB [Proteobacteria bacterium]|nr:tRNA (guanosine(46)-N7)-methyltransferase TrmB [Pseudomonadota bacterium]
MGKYRPRGRAEIGIRELDAKGRPRYQFYGRRQGHKLRAGRRQLLDDKLPALRFPDGGDPAEVADACERLRHDAEGLWLEVGFGAGEHLAAQARANPNVVIVGCEPFQNGVAALLATIEQESLTNIRIHDDDVRPLLESLPGASIDRIFILHPDPWPKLRHQRRRIISPSVLDQLARIAADDAELRFATDHMEYARWTLDHFLRHEDFEWSAQRAADWRQRPAGMAVTRYEAKARAAGGACVYLNFHRKARPKPLSAGDSEKA